MPTDNLTIFFSFNMKKSSANQTNTRYASNSTHMIFYATYQVHAPKAKKITKITSNFPAV